MRRSTIGLLAYAAVAIFTFGRDASVVHKCQDAGKEVTCGSGLVAIAGVFAGALWPLYWSWELQS